MNEFETIEQDLSRLAAEKPPSNLRSKVLEAIQSQRDADAGGILLAPCGTEHARLRKLERTATFAATGLLALSLLIFAIVDRSASGLYQGRCDYVTQTQPLATRYDAKPITGQDKPADSPKAFFRRHFAMLQQFNSELFYGTSKKIPQTGGDRKPLGHFRSRLGFRVLQLASIASSRSEIDSAA